MLLPPPRCLGTDLSNLTIDQISHDLLCPRKQQRIHMNMSRCTWSGNILIIRAISLAHHLPLLLQCWQKKNVLSREIYLWKLFRVQDHIGGNSYKLLWIGTERRRLTTVTEEPSIDLSYIHPSSDYNWMNMEEHMSNRNTIIWCVRNDSSFLPGKVTTTTCVRNETTNRNEDDHIPGASR